MKKLLQLLKQSKQREHIEPEILYQCERGCILSKEMLFILNMDGMNITKCPYCGTDRIQIIN